MESEHAGEIKRKDLNNTINKMVYLGDIGLHVSEKDLEEILRNNLKKNLKILKQPYSSFALMLLDDAIYAEKLLRKGSLNIHGFAVLTVLPQEQAKQFDPNANLIIKNLEENINENEILEKFAEFGEILSCKLVRDKDGESKCYAYLQFKDKESANQAIDKLNNTCKYHFK